MIKFASLASGSSGNCSVCCYGEHIILIDAGISCKRIVDALKSLDIDAAEIEGIFITHEHSDHISGLKVLCKKYNIPVYGSKGTMSELACKEVVPHELINIINPGETISIGELNISSYESFHDTAQPTWYRVDAPKDSVAVITDIGHIDEKTILSCKNLSAILLEANHDIRMLETGPYTFALKRRILSDHGHLSNEASGQLLCSILHDNLRAIALGHLSKENNYPDIALMAVKNEIDFAPIDYISKQFNIFVAARENVTKILWE